MWPPSPSVRTRRRQGGGEMPTRLASSTLVIRPSAWISARIFRSISSRFFDTRIRFPVWHYLRYWLATVLAQRTPGAQFYCACDAIFRSTTRKIRVYGLQFLHSSPDDLAFSETWI